ncbi:MAG: hypothetical protein JSV79_07185 [Armatimonadota bacterium]|nr:MAG: hypothetical protein JSV79_07185 [Armatimonadota bacterium]
MESKAVTFAVLAALIVAAAILVGFTIREERAKAVTAEVQAVTPELTAEEARQVVCAVCGGKHPRDEMYVAAVESLGYAPDSTPVMVCSELCAEKTREDPEKYREALSAE